MRNVLIIYASRQHPMRASQRDHLRAFGKYADGWRCFYVNVAFGSLPRGLERVAFDLVIFHWLFVGARVEREWFERKLGELAALKSWRATKVVLPQDEFISMDLLCRFIRDFGVEYVCSVAPESEWSKLYRDVDRTRVRFRRVLTGYLDDALVAEMGRRSQGRIGRDRRIDVGYRSVSTAIWGRFNLIKREIGELFQRVAPAHGLRTDIKIGPEHFLLGDAWLEFLLDCRYTLGVEGGSSMLDWDGSLFARITRYLAVHPHADFDELERTCVPPGIDGQIRVAAISPRNLEACVTRTCQVLVEGEYNDILQPGTHYIELKRDYSNLDAVLAAMKDETGRRQMVERAYQDVVASGRWTYRSFVDVVLSVAGERGEGDDSLGVRVLYAYARAREIAWWAFVYAYSRARDLRNMLRRVYRHA